MSKGSEALRKALRKQGRGEPSRLARIVGRSRQAVDQWARGVTTPADDGTREILRNLYGIDPQLWESPRERKRAALMATRLASSEGES